MRISVASIGLNPLLPKNPATNLPNLPARSFRILSLCSSCHHSPFSHRESKVGSPVASIPSKSSVSKCAAHVPFLPPSEKWPVCLKAQEGDRSAHSCLTPVMAQVESSSYIGHPRPACSPIPARRWASWDISTTEVAIKS